MLMNTSTNTINSTLQKPFLIPENNKNGLCKSARGSKASVGALFSRKLSFRGPPPRPRGRNNNVLEVKAIASIFGSIAAKLTESVTVTISVEQTVGGFLNPLNIPDRGIDEVTDVLSNKVLHLKLTSVDGNQKELEEHAYRYYWTPKIGVAKFRANFKVPSDFGEVGAVSVTNQHNSEMFIKDIVIDGLPSGKVDISCNSWVHSSDDNNDPRVFFTKTSYLPSQTPSGLTTLRNEELERRKGNGKGERQKFERIYDYDTYNDLGDPKKADLSRPVLGGKQFPYPRRCRTGRDTITIGDETYETRSSDLTLYVPRDESFSELKMGQFGLKGLYSALHGVIPLLEAQLINADSRFPYFTAIELLYNEGINLPVEPDQQNILLDVMPRLMRSVTDVKYNLLRFEQPESFKRDRFCWLSDEEFARQTLAGINPMCIKCVTDWPLKSNLDPNIYGPVESGLTTELVQKEMNSSMTVDEAIRDKRLFIIDYHDVLLSYVNKVREQKGTTMYGSRALFFLDDERKTLRPLAIELTRPPSNGKPQWKEVFTPGTCATSEWLWKFAKFHAVVNDSVYHQIVNHWLRTHCCTEPYIIAANRCLSEMHPIYRLLHPHFRYTMEINALARQALISADGFIEKIFSPRKYSMELGSVIYGSEWRFDHEALPADLISRGMAVEDPSEPHGVRLMIDDYPYAKDGLDLWGITKEWVTEYVNHYYPNPTLIESDKELNSWWTEVRTKGHGDKKDESWWPTLKTPKDLINIITTIIWVASGHHAAVNFGQYTYGGYFPNRPTIARTNMPTEETTDSEMESFIKRPEETILEAFPSQIQAITNMIVLDLLSSHSPEEEYLGLTPESSWEAEPKIMAAFNKFNGRLHELDESINKRNADTELKNRSGVGVVPYELLKRISEHGVTSMGVPNSISI